MKSKPIYGKPLAHNAGARIRYNQSIQAMVEIMVNETKKSIVKLFDMGPAKKFYANVKAASAMDDSISAQATVLTNKLLEEFNLLFKRNADRVAKTMVNNQQRISTAVLVSSTQDLLGNLSLKGNLVSPELETVSEALITANVALMKSLPQQYMKDITGEVMRSITNGRGLQDLIPALEKYEGITKRRARDIAYDQTRKAFTAINKQKMLDLGLKKFKWLHSGGSQYPRHSHLHILNGKILSFKNLEKQQEDLGVPKRDQGLPGEPINCGCTMMTVLDWGNDE